MIFDAMIQTGDWKGEKHVPVITAPERFAKDATVEVRVSIGDAIGHPNTMEHYISWVKLFYVQEGKKFAVELGNYQFTAHGEGEAFSEPSASVKVKLPGTGKIYAMSYCNIHGLWGNAQDITME